MIICVKARMLEMILSDLRREGDSTMFQRTQGLQMVSSAVSKL